MDSTSSPLTREGPSATGPFRLLIQHAHLEGEISGVTTSIEEMLPALAACPGVEVRVLVTKALSLADQFRAVWTSDAVMLNSNCMSLMVFGRLLGRRVVLKLHYTQYQTVHWDHTPMPFSRRIPTELHHLLSLDSSPRYVALSIGRLAMRTAVALMASRVCAPSRHGAIQASLPREVAVHRNPMEVQRGLRPRDRKDLDQPPRFVFIGRISREKGWDVLIEAARLLLATCREFSIDVVGDGPEMGSLRAAAAHSSLEVCFRFHGRLSQRAAKSVLDGALAAIVPSRMQEAFGYVPLEAASVQVASVVSNAGGLPETAGECCPSFESGKADQLMDCMAAYLDNPDEALLAGRLAYERACREFDPSSAAAELFSLLGMHAQLGHLPLR